MVKTTRGFSSFFPMNVAYTLLWRNLTNHGHGEIRDKGKEDIRKSLESNRDSPIFFQHKTYLRGKE